MIVVSCVGVFVVGGVDEFVIGDMFVICDVEGELSVETEASVVPSEDIIVVTAVDLLADFVDDSGSVVVEFVSILPVCKTKKM